MMQNPAMLQGLMGGMGGMMGGMGGMPGMGGGGEAMDFGAAGDVGGGGYDDMPGLDPSGMPAAGTDGGIPISAGVPAAAPAAAAPWLDSLLVCVRVCV